MDLAISPHTATLRRSLQRQRKALSQAMSSWNVSGQFVQQPEAARHNDFVTPAPKPSTRFRLNCGLGPAGAAVLSASRLSGFLASYATPLAAGSLSTNNTQSQLGSHLSFMVDHFGKLGWFSWGRGVGGGTAGLVVTIRCLS